MTELRFRRVVIACDSVSENRPGIETAARLAALWDAALHGVFVQDEALLYLAALPFARHVGPTGAISETQDENAVLVHFETRASSARALIEAAARAHELGWSFDVVRGQAALATLDLGEDDLLVIEATSRPFAGEFRLDSRLLQAAYQAQRPLLLVRNSARAKDGVVAYAQSPVESARRTIAAAARLALAADRDLTVLLTAGVSPEEARETVELASAKLATRCRIEQQGEAKLALLAGEGGLLVIDADPAVNDAASLKGLAAVSKADILFLR